MKKGSVTKISIIIVWILVFLCLILSSGTGSGWKKAVALFILPLILIIILLMPSKGKKTNDNDSKKNKLLPSVKIKRYGIANLTLGVIMLVSFLYLWSHQGPNSAAALILITMQLPCDIVAIIICIVLLTLTGRTQCEYPKIKKRYLVISTIGLILSLLPITIAIVSIALAHL